MDSNDDRKPALPRLALPLALAAVALLAIAALSMAISRHRAHGRAEAFCAAIPPGTPDRDVTIKALDQSVQVRTDIEPGALVVRFPAWGLSSAVGECRATVVDGFVTATRVVRANDN